MKACRPITPLILLLVLSTGCSEEESDRIDVLSPADAGVDSELEPEEENDITESVLDVTVVGALDSVVCQPSCGGKECGSDQCGGSCGSCSDGLTCSADGLCLEAGELAGFGEECLPTEGCTPEDFGWPDCLDAQCASGICRFPVCTQACGFVEDKVNNMTGEPGPDGVEDEPFNSCGVGNEGPLGSQYRCVNVASQLGVFEGLCIAGTTIAQCKSDVDCAEGERCGLMTVSGLPSLRCVAALEEGLGTGVYCEEYGQLEDVCQISSLCSADGCTAPCMENDDCVPQGVVCEDGTCQGAEGVECQTDGDCSPWRCGILPPQQIDDSGLEGVCEPKSCQSNADCVDPRYICELRLADSKNGVAEWSHVCVLPDPQATLSIGDACTNDGGNAPKCPEAALCYKGICSALCQFDRDCVGTSEQICAVVELPIELDGLPGFEDTLALRVCETFEGVGKASQCEVNEDCSTPSEVCAPIELPALPGLSFLYQIQQWCRVMNVEFGELGDSCGLGEGEGECRLGFCGIGAPDDPVDAMCSETCRDSTDCSPIEVNGETVKTYCRASLYGWNDNLKPEDDLYASTCWPGPIGSTLTPCDPLEGCETDEENCQPTVQASDPTKDGIVEWLCMKRAVPLSVETLGTVGDSCEGDSDCLSGRCRGDKSGGGYCSVSCVSDQECLSGGPTMVCVNYEVIPRALGKAATIRECRKQETCTPCTHHNDCFKGMRCIQVGGLESSATACAYPCDLDDDCTGQDGAKNCRDGKTVDGEEEGTCAPASCDF